jgi:hypothetical protein
VWTLLKDESGCLGEITLELLEQGQRLTAHSLLNHRKLAQRSPAEDRLPPNTGRRNPTLPSGSPQRSTQLWTGQGGGLGRCWRDGQNRTSIRMRQTNGRRSLNPSTAAG